MLAIVAVVALVVFQQFAGISGGGRVAAGLQNAAHGPWFAVVTYLLHIVLVRVMDRPSLWFTFGVALTLAVLTEAFQLVTARDAQWLDVAFDMLGAGAAIAFIAGRSGIAAGLVFVSLAPAFAAVAIQLYRDALFPNLLPIEAPWRFGLLDANSPVAVTSAPPSMLKVTFADTTWPGVTLPEPVPDWSGYETLEVNVLAPVAVPLTISIRLANADVDHVYRTFELAAGESTIRMPITELFDVDSVRVTSVVIYSTRPYTGYSVYLARVALTGN